MPAKSDQWSRLDPARVEKLQRPQLNLRLMGARQTHSWVKPMVTLTLKVQLSFRQLQGIILLLLMLVSR